MRVLVVSLLLLAAVPACGADEPAATTLMTTARSGSTPGASTTVATTDPTTSTSVARVTTTTEQQADVEFRDGEVTGPEVIEVDLGDEVDVWVLSDVDHEIHVHGYDLYFNLAAGELFHLSFVPDVPGIFEVEVHTGHTLLFNLEVSG